MSFVLCAKHDLYHLRHGVVVVFWSVFDAKYAPFRGITRGNSYMELTQTQVVLLKHALKALPVATTVGGALLGYVEGHEIGRMIAAAVHGVAAEPSAEVFPWRIAWENAAIGTILGLTGGMVLSCLGLIFSDFITASDDPVRRYTKPGSGVEGAAGNKTSNQKTYYKKYDVGDHERSTQKVAAKYDDQRQKAEAETQEILEIGTVGVREKKLGKRVDNKTSIPERSEP